MFNNLQVESKLDIFKYWNIEQLTSVRQTNYYFNSLIGRYEGELARKKFERIDIEVRKFYFFYLFISDWIFPWLQRQIYQSWRWSFRIKNEWSTYGKGKIKA